MNEWIKKEINKHLSGTVTAIHPQEKNYLYCDIVPVFLFDIIMTYTSRDDC